MSKPCTDDSCDGAHCTVCNGHFIDWYGGRGECSSCQGLDDAQKAEAREAAKKAWEDVYGPTYVGKDAYGTPFRVVHKSGHEWDVYGEVTDEFGKHDEHMGDVDDCDTEQEAIRAWFEWSQDDVDATREFDATHSFIIIQEGEK
jgi:hypothetical protein